MFANILVPLDGTAQSNAALPLARIVAQTTGAPISLVRVVNPSEDLQAAQVLEDLQRVAKELSAGTASVNCAVREGEETAREILDEIQQGSVELVIMCTRGRAGLERAVLGSVTQDVVANSRVPIMLLRPGGRQITHIGKLLVPVDGSPGATLALGTAARFAQVTGASIELLEVAMPVSMWMSTADAYAGMAYYDPAWDEEALAAAQSYVDSLVARLRKANIAAEGAARQATVVPEAIVSAADASDADLIVMSTRALTGPARALLGSTADAVVRKARCPVLLIHRTPIRDERAA
jgi:nucleotide-binding universal stress UspA family protein